MPRNHSQKFCSLLRKYVAVCETGEKPTINIYDLQTLKRKKSLGIPYDAPGVTRFSCVSFSFDSRSLAAVTGEPDQTMLYYAWEKGKVESSIKVGGSQNSQSTVKYITCNPGDGGVLAVAGPYVFKFLTVSETVWRPYGFAKADNILISSLTWLNTDRLLAGTRDGRILYLENGDLKNIYKMTETNFMNLKIREEYVMQTTASQSSILECGDDAIWEHDVRSLVSFQRGFAFGLGLGTVVVFEREGQHKYTRRNVFAVPSQVSRDPSDELYRINSISPNSSSDGLLVTTGWSQLFHAKLWGPDLLIEKEPQFLSVMGQQLHHGSIGGLSVCAWKSVFMTCGEIDRSVRIWDYETESLVMMKQYQEDVCCVALHPIGLFCLVGFSDKLRFMSILMDDLSTIHEVPVRNCRTVAFSHGGHLFAAVNGNVVQVYTTIGFANRYLLKGHTGKIKGVAWSRSDMKLVSIGSDGAMYEWDMSSGRRSSEVIVKGVVLNSVALTADGSTVYCVGNDSRIREIRENAVIREYSLRDNEMELMTMGRDDFAMFVTSPGGVIVSLKYPLQEPLDSTEFHLHSADVTNLCLSYDEQILISSARDGTLCFWRIFKLDGVPTTRDGEFTYTDEVLIGKGDLHEKIQTIRDQSVRMRELETEHAYKIRQTEVQHNDKIRDLHAGYCDAIEELREKIETLKEERTNELNNINVEITRMKTSHEEAVRKMEINYDAKLINEYDKYRAFEERNNAMRESYEKRLEELEKRSAAELDATVKRYEAQLHAKNLQLEETHEEMAHQVRVHEKLKQHIEDDADREIVDIRAGYEAKIHEERETNLKLKGEAGVLRNKYFATRKDIDDLKRQVVQFQTEQTQFQKTVQELERDVLDLKKEITERDVTIQDKEKRIYDLKRNNQELEKFKFVLNYKIRELKSQIEPRDEEIKELKEKIRDMENELVNLQKTNVSLELQLHELREKLGGSRRENETLTARNRRCQGLLRKIRVDLTDAAGLIQDPNALKTAVKNLYHRYSADDEFLRSRKSDLDAQCEFVKQRHHLERTVDSLRKQVFHESGDSDKEVAKMMEENVELIVEINAFREELKKARRHISDMESLLGITRGRLDPREARKKLSEACHGREELRRDYESKMQDCERLVATLQDDVKRLLGEVRATSASLQPG